MGINHYTINEKVSKTRKKSCPEERRTGLHCKYSLEVLTDQYGKIKIHQENVIDKVKNTHYNVFKFLTKMQ